MVPLGLRSLAMVAMGLALWPGLSARVASADAHLLNKYLHEQDQRLSDLGRQLLARAQPGDRLAIWGWRASLYTETGLP